MTERLIAILFGLCTYAATTQPQILQQRLYTTFDFPVAATQEDRQWLWIASSGGVYRYHFFNSSIAVLDPLQMFSIDLTALTYDSVRHLLIIGSNEGFLQLYDLAAEQWLLLPEIFLKRSEYGSVAINTLFLLDSLLLVGADFGFVIVNLNTRLFTATVTQLPDVPFPKVHAFAVWNDSLWIATSHGIFSAAIEELRTRNPADLQLWHSHRIPNDNATVLQLELWNNTLIAGTESAVYRYDGATFERLYTVSYPPLKGIAIIDSALWVADRLELRQLGTDVAFGTFPTRIQGLSKVTIGPIAAPLLLTEGEGAWLIHPEAAVVTDTIRPNAIATRIVGDLAFAPDGSLWYATDIDQRGRGFGRLKDGKWQNFLVSSYPELETNDWHRIFIQRDGTVWVSSWGKGILEVFVGDSILQWQRWDHRNAPLTPFQGDFVVIGDIAEDAYGNLWVTNPWGDGLVVRSQAEWHIVFPSIPKTNRFSRLVADPVSGMWVASHLNPSGLWFFNPGNDLQSKLDDSYQHLTTADGLLNNQINTLFFDTNGWLWIGTPKGLQVLLNPRETALGGEPLFYTIEETKGQIIFSMDEDATNLLWIGTNSGVWLLDLQTLEVVSILDDDVLPNFDLSILAIRCDRATGWNYLGTRKALLALKTSAVTSLQIMDSVHCFPQPFVIGKNPYLTITNLPAQSTVLILTPAGERIREIPAKNSAMVIWDGLTDTGKPAAPGVYIILYRSAALGKEGACKIFVRHP